MGDRTTRFATPPPGADDEIHRSPGERIAKQRFATAPRGASGDTGDFAVGGFDGAMLNQAGEVGNSPDAEMAKEMALYASMIAHGDSSIDGQPATFSGRRTVDGEDVYRNAENTLAGKVGQGLGNLGTGGLLGAAAGPLGGLLAQSGVGAATAGVADYGQNHSVASAAESAGWGALLSALGYKVGKSLGSRDIPVSQSASADLGELVESAPAMGGNVRQGMTPQANPDALHITPASESMGSSAAAIPRRYGPGPALQNEAVSVPLSDDELLMSLADDVGAQSSSMPALGSGVPRQRGTAADVSPLDFDRSVPARTEIQPGAPYPRAADAAVEPINIDHLLEPAAPTARDFMPGRGPVDAIDLPSGPSGNMRVLDQKRPGISSILDGSLPGIPFRAARYAYDGLRNTHPDTIARTTGGIGGVMSAATSWTGSKANAQEPGKAYAGTPTLSWSVQSVLSGGGTGLPPDAEQRLTEAVLSGDDSKLVGVNFQLQQKYPSYAKRVESELRALNGEDAY